MSRYRTERWVALLTVGLCGVLLVLLVGTLTATDAPLDPYNSGEQGTSRLAQASGETIALSYTALRKESTPEIVLVVGGGEAVTTADVAALGNHLDSGGTVVFLTEDERSNRLLGALGVESRVAAGYLLATEGQASEPMQFAVADGGQSSLRFTSVQVNAARPLGIAAGQEGASRTVLAWSVPAGRDLDADGQIGEAEPRGTYPVAVEESVGAGRVVLVGDVSLLTNGQWQVDGNRRLARALTGDDAMVVYPQTAGFARISQLRLGLTTPLGVVLGLPLFCGGTAAVVWLGVRLCFRQTRETANGGVIRITLK